MPSHRLATTSVAHTRRARGGDAGGRHRGPGSAATAWQPRTGGGHRATRVAGRPAFATPARPRGGVHRDPRGAATELAQIIAPAAAGLRDLLPPAAALRRLRPPPGGLRRIVTEPRFALVAALLAAVVLLTDQAHDRLTDDDRRIPTAGAAQQAPARPPAAPAPAERGATAPQGDSAPPATVATPGPAPTTSTDVTGRPGAASAAPPAPPPAAAPGASAASAGVPPVDPGRVEVASPSTSPTSPVPTGSGPAGSVRRTGTTGVALTFDDGPDPVNTPRLLDLLKQQDVRATFCVVGSRARAHPDLIQRIVAEGHAICNHSWDHSFALGVKPVDEIRLNLEATNQAIRAAVPNARISHFRAPGGFFTARLVAVASSYGMKSAYWEVDPRDWEHQLGQTPADHVAKIIRIVQTDTRPGSMVLSHDFLQPTTITAYETLLPWLKERFTLVPLPSP